MMTINWNSLSSYLKKDKLMFISHKNASDCIMHDHDFIEISYITRGRVENNLDGVRTVLHKGDYFIVDYGSCHSYKNIDPSGFDNVDCVFLPELIDPVFKGTKSFARLLEHYILNFSIKSLGQNPTRTVFHDDDGKILEIINKMLKEESDREIGCNEIMRAYFVQILLLTLRKIKKTDNSSVSSDISGYIISYILEHYTEEFTLKEISQDLHYSLPYVSKVFKEETGTSFLSYLQNYRITQGCRMIINSKMKLSEVAEKVGYRDVKFFSELVKKYTGLTPRELRRKQSFINYPEHTPQK